MNEIALVINAKDVDTKKIPQILTLPSGLSTLTFKMISREVPPVSTLGIPVKLTFFDNTTRKVLVSSKAVKSASGIWTHTSSKPADASGIVNFDLDLDESQLTNVRIEARIMDGDARKEFINSLTYYLNVRSTDNSSQVTELKMVNGDKQLVQLDTGNLFSPVEVQAFNGAKPVDGAKVTFVISPTRGAADTVLPAAATVKTSGSGFANVTPIAGKQAGLLTVTATCNGHSVTFHLTVLPAWKDLELTTIIPNSWPMEQATDPHPIQIQISTVGIPAEYWPEVPCKFKAVTVSANLKVEGIPATSTEITSNLLGMLPAFNISFVSVKAKKVGNIVYSALLPGNKQRNKALTIHFSMSA